ncbi:histidine kinase/DNA gyrase B/HSP90-like ATPase [Geodermatophilus normandii]|uniref:histidine kinase n=1 Tax=Geodermatophilus normandii TaxID=1137989 RepID=A0A317QNQ7_9ACTN|nr:sensor histidine kinase [Geodermatophilus normandii]PWW24972.1 histidine kinase/DNA gyrase B/HSP90-like ATPase [Geodermatophilus normandii]
MPAARTVAAGAAAVAGLAMAVAALVLALTGVPDAGPATVAWGLAGAGGSGVLGAVVAAARPRLLAGWLMLLVGVSSGGVALAATVAAALVPADPASAVGAAAFWLSTWLWVPAYVPVVALLLQVLPDGRLPGRGWTAAAGVGAATVVLAPVGWALTPYDQQDRPVAAPYRDLVNPVGVDGAFALAGLSLVLVLAGTVAGVASLVVRLRRSGGREREQVLWVLAGALATVLLLVLAWSVPAAETALIAAALLPLPAATAWALVRTRLWDLDPALARTLVYLSLTLLALALHGVLLVLAGRLLGRLGEQSDLLVFALAAVLVQPARDALQRGVNRLLYGDVVEPGVVVGELGRRVDSATAPSQVLPGVVEVLARTLRLPSVALHLPGSEPVTAGRAPGSGDDVRTLPLVHQGRTVGRLDVVLPAGGLGPRLRDLLDELVRQTAQAAHAVLLAGELQRSRESIVTSREEERRRLRHDLHDDLGPVLAATAMQLEAAAELVPADPARATAMLDRAAGHLRASVADVRRIVDDLRPAALGDLGLAGAVRAHAARLADGGVAVTVDVPGDLGELPAAVEVAALRIVGEAMTNVARHARATRAHVTITHRGTALEVCVEDDGIGVRPGAATGVGLGSMHQRAAELGGTCTVSSGPGTTVRACLPTGAA